MLELLFGSALSMLLLTGSKPSIISYQFWLFLVIWWSVLLWSVLPRFGFCPVLLFGSSLSMLLLTRSLGGCEETPLFFELIVVMPFCSHASIWVCSWGPSLLSVLACLLLPIPSSFKTLLHEPWTGMKVEAYCDCLGVPVLVLECETCQVLLYYGFGWIPWSPATSI